MEEFIDDVLQNKIVIAIGIKIILHCFKYWREEQESANSLCEAVLLL
ncbi:MAG: hypothetical protein IPJ22_01785 [Bacteroidetes bacterium]|nr:hypothetical protein [Bacteroidota bacterium]